MSEIRITLQGNAGEDPRLWRNGTRAFARFNVASTPRVRTNDEWTDGDTQWLQIKAWGNLAENIAASIRKGDAVMVTGTFRHDTYTNDDGVVHKTAVIHASGVGFDLKRSRAQAVKVREDAPRQDEASGSDGWPEPAEPGGAEIQKTSEAYSGDPAAEAAGGPF